MTWAMRVASTSSITGSGGSSSENSWPRSAISGRLVSTAFATTAARSTLLRRSSILPREIRETSRRSSKSRERCLTCRSITSRGVVQRVRQRRHPHQMRRVADRCERIAQLVRKGREKLVLAAIGFAQRLLRLLALDDVSADLILALARRGVPHAQCSRARPRAGDARAASRFPSSATPAQRPPNRRPAPSGPSPEDRTTAAARRSPWRAR